jgi:acetyltransferase-like isoleucine patch superfamily enzyme
MNQPETAGWDGGPLPANVTLGHGSIVIGPQTFRRFRSRQPQAIVVGAHSTLDGCQLSLGEQGRLIVGDYTLLSGAIIMGEEEIRIGSYVSIGWNVAIADSDFHPIDPALRQQDVIACSTIGGGRPRPRIACKPVIIEDEVWIGPCAAIMKGVRIGAGSIIDPGSMVTRDVPPGSRVLGNPARIQEKTDGAADSR